MFSLAIFLQDRQHEYTNLMPSSTKTEPEDTQTLSEITETENPITAVAGQFGLNGQIFAAQLINFLLVLVILWRFVYRPIVNRLDERQEKIEKSVKQADSIEKRVAQIELEREDVLSVARREAQKISEQAHEHGQARHEEIVSAAKREVERVITKGKEQLTLEKDLMMKEVRKDIVDIAVKAAARILQEGLDEKKSQSLAEETVRKMT